MALLQNGKIFYIKVGMEDYKDEFGKYPDSGIQYCNWFMEQFSENLAITDSDYNQIKSIDLSYVNPYYFLLPYINKDTKEKLALRFILDDYPKIQMNITKQKTDNSLFFTTMNILNYCAYETEEGNKLNTNEKYIIETGKYTTFVVDTRFLDSHGFYTIGAIISSNKILEGYVTSTNFICDTINKFDKKHIDGFFSLLNFGQGTYPDFSTASNNMLYNKVTFDSPSISVLLTDYDGGTGFYPQVFTNEEDAFSIVKIHFGQFRPAKDIYLTRVTTNILASFCYCENMLEEKNSWKEIERTDFFGGKRNFLLGLNSIYSEDKSPSNEWIPVIEEIKEPFALKFSSDEDFSLFVEHPNWDGAIEYSKDKGKTWVEWNGERLNGNVKQSIYLRGTGNTIITGHNSTIKNDTYDIFYRWDFTGKYIYGNIETLLDYKTVQKGNHPPMGNSCYRGLFYGCSALREVPELPAIELKDYCYTRMFMKCTSLLAPPELPSTKLATYCYGNMFFECTSLTKTTKLPATTLAPFCYIGMFQFCYSLVEVPKLPALIMAESCYESMFFGCSILNEVPELPSTSLAKRCYDEMFAQCHALTKMPKLPATSLAIECYRYMFIYCYQIKISRTKTSLYQYSYRIPVSGAGTNATNALNNMFYGTSGTFTGTPSMYVTYYTSNEVV